MSEEIVIISKDTWNPVFHERCLPKTYCNLNDAFFVHNCLFFWHYGPTLTNFGHIGWIIPQTSYEFIGTFINENRYNLFGCLDMAINPSSLLTSRHEEVVELEQSTPFQIVFFFNGIISQFINAILNSFVELVRCKLTFTEEDFFSVVCPKTP